MRAILCLPLILLRLQFFVLQVNISFVYGVLTCSGYVAITPTSKTKPGLGLRTGCNLRSRLVDLGFSMDCWLILAGLKDCSLMFPLFSRLLAAQLLVSSDFQSPGCMLVIHWHCTQSGRTCLLPSEHSLRTLSWRPQDGDACGQV